MLSPFLKLNGVKAAVSSTAAEITGSDLPDHIASGLEVVFTYPALAGVMGKLPHLRPAVHGFYGIAAQ
ncbi:hypothetical protein FQZ97_817120 [compost metagenome]